MFVAVMAFFAKVSNYNAFSHYESFNQNHPNSPG